MKSFFIVILCFVFVDSISYAQSFVIQQKKYERVRKAYSDNEASVKLQLTEGGFKFESIHILLIAYKQDMQLELWVKNSNQKNYTYLKTYPFCALSGQPGPKRISGDGQVPEGFYYIKHFNPTSNFYLSLGLNYPNNSDRILSDKTNPGGDIYIHGNCVTIGCIPITDDLIKELYVFAVQAKNAGQQKIPVYIFPARFSESSYNLLKANNSHLVTFWNNLKIGYDRFNNQKQELQFTVDKNGSYIFK